MQSCVKYVLLIPFLAVCVQFSYLAISMQGERKQKECRTLGIVFTSIGIVGLVFRDVWFAAAALVLIMIGLRLIAKGLDRLDKTTFIDRYNYER